MKNLKTLLLVMLLTFGVSSVVNAQKFAHINAQLIAAMPQTKALQAEMEKLQKTYKDKITDMAKKLEAKIQKYSAEQATQTETVNEQRAQELQEDRAIIQQAEQAAYEDMQNYQAEKLSPILQLAQKAIKDVANEKEIIYVIDASPGKGLLVYEKGEDLFNAVKAKLGF